MQACDADLDDLNKHNIPIVGSLGRKSVVENSLRTLNNRN